MIVILFKPEFAAKVASGEKRQTIRPERKRRPEIGNQLSLRRWSGAPYRSKQILLSGAVVTDVDSIWIGASGITLGTFALNPNEEWDLSKADGFNSPQEMTDWFNHEYGLPFNGIVIRWELKQ